MYIIHLIIIYLTYIYYKETLAKITHQNMKIISKLDTIILKQNSLEERFTKLEESCNKNRDRGNNKIDDVEFIQVRFK